MLICPVCGARLDEEEKRAKCENGHSFDRARQGYFHLLCRQGSGGHGDDAAMLLARRRFLEAGYYDLLVKRVAEMVEHYAKEHVVLLDAGCGEGYYTQKTVEHLEGAGKTVCLYAFDISKDAVRMSASRMAKRGHFFVASTFAIPLADGAADVILSLFAPYAEEEFLRVLRPGGVLIRAVPLEEHLYELKCAVYENPVKNEKRASIGEGFSLCREEEICGEIHLASAEDVRSLFEMTPYAHKTSPADRKKLEGLNELSTKVSFGLICYEKK